MREILFRGQTRKRGEKVMAESGEELPGQWVYGGVFPQNKGGSYSIIYTYEPIGKEVVYADTVGQYTGRTDKNGVKIFEGDIVRISLPITGASPIVHVSEVYFDECCFCVNWGGNYRPHYRTRIDSFAPDTTFEVIGNIYDNPELLSEEE